MRAPLSRCARARSVSRKSTPMTILTLARRRRVPLAVRRRERPIGVELARLTRYRGGTYSHTVDTVVFTDGTAARTDLIRLNPNVEAYSLDFGGVCADAAVALPGGDLVGRAATCAPGRTRPRSTGSWRNSFPTVGTAELSRRLRAAGYPLKSANVAEHEAIAATQAAIWYFTNDLQLDDRPRNEPVSTVRDRAVGDVRVRRCTATGRIHRRRHAPTSPRRWCCRSRLTGCTWRDVAGSGSRSAAPVVTARCWDWAARCRRTGPAAAGWATGTTG